MLRRCPVDSNLMLQCGLTIDPCHWLVNGQVVDRTQELNLNIERRNHNHQLLVHCMTPVHLSEFSCQCLNDEGFYDQGYRMTLDVVPPDATIPYTADSNTTDSADTTVADTGDSATSTASHSDHSNNTEPDSSVELPTEEELTDELHRIVLPATIVALAVLAVAVFAVGLVCYGLSRRGYRCSQKVHAYNINKHAANS